MDAIEKILDSIEMLVKVLKTFNMEIASLRDRLTEVESKIARLENMHGQEN